MGNSVNTTRSYTDQIINLRNQITNVRWRRNPALVSRHTIMRALKNGQRMRALRIYGSATVARHPAPSLIRSRFIVWS